MKVTYFNDENFSVNVCVQTLANPVEVLPQTMATFELEPPEGTHVFVKKWDYGSVLISSIPDQY